MSHYDEVLSEARKKASGTAKEYIPRLYHILVDEENKTPEDARDIIEHDLIEYWAKSTVKKFLPQEAKDETKQEAGKKGAEKKKIMLLADGSRAGTEFQQKEELEDLIPKTPVPVKESEDFYEEYKKDTALEIPETQIIQKKTSDVQSLIENKILTEENIFEWLRKRENGIGRFWYDAYGIEGFKNRELAQLKNSGVKTFKRLYFEV